MKSFLLGLLVLVFFLCLELVAICTGFGECRKKQNLGPSYHGPLEDDL